MTLRPEYALGHSPYNDFLFASVGEEKTGQQLTVLTALARLGFDPWQEAARLSKLPQEVATRVFAVTIAALPEGDWKSSDSEAIAARLVNCLPGRSVHAIPLLPGLRPTADTERRSERDEARKSPLATWLVLGVLAVAAVFLMFHLQADRNLEPAAKPQTITVP